MGISKNGVHASVVLFSDSAELEIQFLDDIDDFVSAVDALDDIGGTTRIDRGLDVAFNKMFQTTNGMRPYGQCNKVVVLMTDGVNSQPFALVDAVKRFHHAGIKVVVVGIGNKINITELLSLVKVHSDFYMAQDFDKLASDSFVDSIVVCEKLPSKSGYIYL